MSARAFDGNTEAGRSGNPCDDPQGDFLTFQQRALLDLQFHKCFVVCLRQFYFSEVPFESCLPAHFLERGSIFVRQPSRGVRRHVAREQAAPETPDPKTCGFFRSKYKQLDGVFGMESALLERSNRLQAPQHANNAIILSCVGNRVNMGTSSYRRSTHIGTRPTRENVSNRILSYSQSGFLATGNEPRARLEICRRENNPRYCGRFCVGDAR